MLLKILFLLSCGFIVVSASAGPNKLNDVVTNGPTDPEGINFRLPNNTIPIHYNIYISTDIHRPSLFFNGSLFLRFRTLEPSTTITLHSKQARFGIITLDTAEWERIETYVDYEVDEVREFIIIKPQQALPANQEFYLGISYTSMLRDDDFGFYYGSYVTAEGNERFYAMTQFQPTDARHAFPW
jgi:aminopeptidase N